MRNRISLIRFAALMLGACGDKTPSRPMPNCGGGLNDRTGKPRASPARPRSRRGPSRSRTRQTAFRKSATTKQARLFATYSTAQPHQHLGYYMSPVGVEAGRP